MAARFSVARPLIEPEPWLVNQKGHHHVFVRITQGTVYILCCTQFKPVWRNVAV